MLIREGRMLALADSAAEKGFADDAVTQEVMDTYKRIGRLRNLSNCGVCGTTRYPTLPYWSLGMRVCRYCMQANLVSDTVLDERYWADPLTMDFLKVVARKVFYFHINATPRQRYEYTQDPLDFDTSAKRKVGYRVPVQSWFFWRPHLEQVLPMARMEEEARTKHAAAAMVRAFVRRALTLETLSCRGRRVCWSKRPDKRVSLFKLNRPGEPAKRYAQHNALIHQRFVEFEDRVGGFLPPISNTVVALLQGTAAETADTTWVPR